ncbi:MAG: glycoside hydrolase family 15 protein [Candidatus Saccharimonadales bacterium]
MTRPIVLSNGELHVGLNDYGLVHDFYYPYVGYSNHSSGAHTRHRVGIWVDGRVSWLDDPNEWTFKFRYPQNALIGHTIAKNESMQIVLEIDDAVDAHTSAFMRNIHIVNLVDHPRDIRLFMHQAFIIDDSRSNTDTAQYLPDSDAVLHYRGRRAFVISGDHNGRPFDQHSVGLFGIEGREGTYRDADDGELSESNVEHGRVDSTIRFKMEIKAHSSERVHYWIAVGSSIRDALDIDKQIRHDGVGVRLNETAKWWHKWLEPAMESAKKIDPKYHESFLKSVMIMKSQMDKRGAVIASTDSSLLKYSRDTYAYCWTRDGAMVMWPFIRMGYTDEPYKFFEFCKRVMHPSGYLMHKYNAEGGLGASWHPYVHEGLDNAPPIQEDETALVLFVFSQFYEMNHDKSLLREFYDSMIKPMANWMSEYLDEVTGLPKPSYDLWEEKFLTTTFTTATVYASLQAAADLADEANDKTSAVKWRASATDIHDKAHKYLFNESKKSFYKGILVKGGNIEYDDAIDASSIYGAFMFGLFAMDSSQIKSSMNSFLQAFPTRNGIVAFPRYEKDSYRQSSSEGENWWFITTLWIAQYWLETGDAESAKKVIDWVNDTTAKAGTMPEQIDPVDQSLIPPSPLTWTHAEYLSTLLDTIK